MWTEVGFDDLELLQRFVDIMKMMSKRYQRVTVEATVRPWLKTRGGKIYYYKQGVLEIVLVVVYSPKRSLYRLNTVGFLNGAPQQVFDILCQKLKTLLALEGTNEAYAIVPLQWDYPPMAQFVELAPTFPGAQITVNRVSRDRVEWFLVFV